MIKMENPKNSLYASLSPKKIMLVFVILILIVLILFSCFSPKKNGSSITADPDEFIEATVTKIVDGDTLWVEWEEGSDKVRLIGIDAPERQYYSDVKGDGDFAAEYLESLIKNGDTVYLQADITNKDDYNRLLRYVWLKTPADREDNTEIKNKMINAMIVYNGYAEAKEYEPDVLYSDVLSKLQKEAQENKSGLWSEDTTE